LVRLGAAGAGEIAELLGITPVRVRQHLNKLLSQGLVTVVSHRGGGPGPRERLWKATPLGVSRARPNRAPLLLSAFFRAAREKLGMSGLASLMEEITRQVANANPPPSSFSERVRYLRELLDSLGVSTVLKEERGTYLLQITNSVFPPEFSSYPEVYAFYRVLAEEVLGTSVELKLLPSPEGAFLIQFKEPQDNKPSAQ